MTQRDLLDSADPMIEFDHEEALGPAPREIDPSAPIAGQFCEEASPLSGGIYVPCLAPAVALVDNRDRRPYYMCLGCALHNVRNRSGKLLATTDPDLALRCGEGTLQPQVHPLVPGLMDIVRILPTGFDLPALLSFLPDVRLKAELDRFAADLLAVSVSGADGVDTADRLRAALSAAIARVESLFDGSELVPGPVKLAYALHKRLTGLRADFVKTATEAVAVVGDRILAENRRLAKERAVAASAAQAEADLAVRRQVEEAAAQAKAAGAPKAVVQALKTEARTATAPPVTPSVRAPEMASSSVVPKWKARLCGTEDGAEPNPDVDQLTTAQQESVMVLLDAIRNSTAPLSAISINWSVVNARAKADKTTFQIPGFEAFDEGGLRKKAAR